MLFWIFSFLIFFIVTIRFRKIQEYIMDCADFAKKRRREKKLRKEWKKILPNIPIHEIDSIFKYYGLISPKDFIELETELYLCYLKSIEQITALLRHLSKILWRFINLSKNNKSIREILRKLIKVIDDEELEFAF